MSESRAKRALLFATLAFAANFSVWTLYAAIVLPLSSQWQLTVTELGGLLAAPMFTGALSRIPAGELADRYSAKVLFVVQMLVCVPALACLYITTSYSQLLFLGLWIGLSGSSFTLGIRYVCDFYQRSQQGTAMGIFGVGNAGAAITLVLAPWLMERYGWQWVGPVYAFGLLFVAVLYGVFAPSQPDNAHVINSKPQTWTLLLKNTQVWRLGLYYYFVFGSFLALLLWLPYYYMQAYQLSIKQAMAFTLFFVATSSVIRALGGWFADKYGGRSVNWSVFWVCLVCLFFLSYPPTTMTIHGIKQDVNLSVSVNVWVFTGLLFVIGLAQGFGRASVFKVIHENYPLEMGKVGGFIAAIGALGGFTLPIMFGAVVDLFGFYSASFMLLYAVLAVCMMLMYFAVRAERYQRRLNEAASYNFLEDDSL
ncbi:MULTISPECIES: MFS transporter [Pseudoalteromonas]|jgi:NNP family nitrate/nitrite transporter-like MFS transporter|uniref:MFS transporter, NNP family, nitrate/nitrite transporter n=1 Tax=Pseudoalteromonas lipolytica TaxID=570156 RepID=A0AAD0S1F7_9GAMM|nr:MULTISPECIES: MFS transporter [Pseudoalteromonas]AXV66301.1 NarK/NasA family nitrate transporter [Pseudoalteromonas donghaensis]MAE01156.1 NarK/NasA family nitrate transporter [Pseudoalteromonas sp.]MBE0349815.1 MFS transporter, NNP family, nitrate/nitrite transporter [Pseudoalteromonas lipolytica LMEB 39]MCC9660866.1 MFS transporter [Pseudoalteromonas sp. MB41]QLJ07828.1 NarK/NasA family nitrate transporter [Pseudoalteromonas sp. JSTW]|tara:strand:- start:22317 stop:23585 length:1269 start_codon:yes stop_codon:yes gene_type:complete